MNVTAFQPGAYQTPGYQIIESRQLRGPWDREQYEKWLQWQRRLDEQEDARRAERLQQVRADRAAGIEKSRKAREEAAARLRRRQDVVLLALFREREKSAKPLGRLVQRKPARTPLPTLDELLAA